MNELRQITAVTALGFRSLHTRVKSSLVIVLGLTCVAVVLLSILSLGEGLRLAMLQSGDPNRAVVMSVGALQENNSNLPRAWAAVIQDAPGVARSKSGAPLADAESLVPIMLVKKSNQHQGGTAIQGMSQTGFAMSPEIKLVAGHWPRSGTREVIAGATAREKFTGLNLGDTVKMSDGSNWPVVGIFSAQTLVGGFLITDPETLSAFLRHPNYNYMLVRLASPDSFEEFKNTLVRNPALRVTVLRETDYYQQFWQRIPNTPFIIAYVLGSLLAVGALAGTISTMHGAVESRASEIAILRAIGFDGFSVAVSVVLEAMLLASVGAVIGTAIDWLWLDGYAYNAVGVFHVLVTFRLLMVAIGWALMIAFIGALSPAIKASRVTVVEALRAY